ncbi:MAG: formamidopyrimidine-DNA glycosylase [Acidobacteria bacterium]|nr:formamidopyrimidine-DNA glycosylase [Acidobacteriota bacterium]
MPELPDVELYNEALRSRFQGQRLEGIKLLSPFVLRSIQPPISEAVGKTILDFERLGKRIVWVLEQDLFLVFHLMISGRFHLRKPEAKPRAKLDLAVFRIGDQQLALTEASSKKRASLHLIRGRSALQALDPGGLEVLGCDLAEFGQRLKGQNRTLKRRLTDPRVFSGIGNAYSDEILHAAQLSPFKKTQDLSDAEVERLWRISQELLKRWIETLRAELKGKFPEKVTAFRKDFAVHGRFGQVCPVCGKAVQRIVLAENESNYCAQCQTGGKMLSDRALARLLQSDWPKTIEEWEALQPNRTGPE